MSDNMKMNWNNGMGALMSSSIYGHGVTKPTTTTMPTLSGASLSYNVDNDTYTVITNDNTEVQVSVYNNTITVNGYKITTDTIKNAIEKIQEEEEYSNPRT